MNAAAVSVYSQDSIRSYLIHVASTKDGIAIMDMVFDLLHASAQDFTVTVNDANNVENGWSIQKIGERFLFQLLLVSPRSGFDKKHGAVYAYKVGFDPEKIDWPGVEFGKLPRHCLLSANDVGPLVGKLRRADSPGKTAGFVFNSTDWDILSSAE
jgi:hypothetical protein